MPPLPFVHFAELDIRKLRDYCLNPDHPEGRGKARVFRSALGITQADAEWLRDEILRLLPDAEAVPARVDRHGARFHVDLPITRLGRRVVVRTAWIVAPEARSPRLVSCRVL